jgi:hypothetical protein
MTYLHLGRRKNIGVAAAAAAAEVEEEGGHKQVIRLTA